MESQYQTSRDLGIPYSQNIVDVSVIDSTARICVPLGFFVRNPVVGHEKIECPAFVILIQHPRGKKILFDLGLRKDTSSFPPTIRNGLPFSPMAAERDVAEILREDGHVTLGEGDSIIWSHWHPDHIGDPSTFPPSVELVVGPGAKDFLLPGYPADPNGLILESDYAGRHLREVDFSTGLQIGGFRAVDYFDDGSFYLLDSPGHAVGHMCALARTTASTFVFLGADGCHHTGSLRPNQHIPLPKAISPSPFSIPPYMEDTVCPGALLEAIHPKRSCTVPYYSQLASAPGRDVLAAEAAINKMIPFDANEDVFVIIAHDKTLLGNIDFFPRMVNEWKEKGWKDHTRWRFLEDFKEAVARSSST
ncbi:beta-lactamase-like protein [Annulohypoxylon moriforme]|nr:beta-lactamase-like protein [Annulohypoxylon moriforme]